MMPRMTAHPPRDGQEVARESLLLADGSVGIQWEPEVSGAIDHWMPDLPPARISPGQETEWIRVGVGSAFFPHPGRNPDVVLRALHGWFGSDGGLLLCGVTGGVSARIRTDPATAEVRIDPSLLEGELDIRSRVAIFEALTLASAMLVGALGRALVHGGGLVAEDGTAWLLTGGTFSGKSTTCVSWLRSGGAYLSDDHVILEDGAAGLRLAGWPRRFNLDDGYEERRSTGKRSRIDPRSFGPGEWQASAPLGGVLLPFVEPAASTAVLPVSSAECFTRLIGQSPWLLADRDNAPALMRLLERTARLPSYSLRLGYDSFADPGRLREVLAPVMETAA
jgi:hypothetical protein